MNTSPSFYLQAIAFSFFYIIFQCSLNATEYSEPFKGEAGENGNALKWTTINEEGSAFFIIEKSIDGLHFKTLATLPSTKSDKERSYHYLDKQDKGLRSFYRLVEVLDNGDGNISPTLVLSRKGNNANYQLTEIAATAAPRDFDITLQSFKDANLHYRIMSNEGKILLKGNIPVIEGQNKVTIPIERLQIGTYQISIKIGGDIEVYRLKKTNSTQQPKDNYADKANPALRN